MSRLSKREQKDKKHGKVAQDCPYQVEQMILAQNKSKLQNRWRVERSQNNRVKSPIQQ